MEAANHKAVMAYKKTSFPIRNSFQVFGVDNSVVLINETDQILKQY
jgi:hypothetical protein